MKGKFRVILVSSLVLLLGITIFLNAIPSVSGQSSSDIDFTFQRNFMYNTTNHNYNPLIKNNRNNRTMTETGTVYLDNTTYSFTDDTTGNDPSDWVVYESACNVLVSDTYLHRGKVLQIDDNGGGAGENGKAWNYFANYTYGTVEFYMAISDATFLGSFYIFDNTVELLRIRIDADKFQYYDGAWKDVGKSAYNSQWYHIRIDYECTAGGYMGLAQYDWHLYINDIHYGDYGFVNNQDEANNINVNSGIADSGYEVYFDSFGYSRLSNYSLGDNINPVYTLNSSIQEVNVYDFGLVGDVNTLRALGSDSYGSWVESDNAEDKINIAYDYDTGEQYQDRVIEFDQDGTDAVDVSLGQNFTVVNGIVNITWNANFSVWDAGQEFHTQIYSYDDTFLYDIYIVQVAGSGYLYYDTGGARLLEAGLSLNTDYVFNLYVNHNYNYSMLALWENTTYLGVYFLHPKATNKTGLGNITFLCEVSALFELKLELDYVGVYVNGSSLSDEFGFRTITYIWLGYGNSDLDWDFKDHNLFTCTGYGTMRFWVSDLTFLWGLEYALNVTDEHTYTGNTITHNVYNLYDGSADYIYLPVLWIQFWDNYSIDPLITIEGINMTDGTNTYIPTFSFGNIDANASYFYVQNDNLRYQIYQNDNETEYIQLNFNINNVLSENRSVRFTSNINGDSAGEVLVGYTDSTTTYVEVPTIYTSTNLILPQEKTITTINFLISDNDLYYTGNTTGLFTSVSLIYYTGLSVSITTINLISIMIPLIIMIVPTLTFYRRFGRKIIFPMFLIMAILCVATNIIPIWLFFIMLLGFALYLFVRFRGGED